MNALTRLAAAAALAAGSLVTSQAMAATICSNCTYTGTTFLGAHNAASFDTSGFRHDGIGPGAGAFTDVWVFDLAPTGASASINANFLPINPIAFSNFNLQLRSVIANGSCLTIGATCGTSPTLGAQLGPNAVNGAFDSNIFPFGLPAGRYAFVVSGTVLNFGGGTAEYSGQLRVSPIPEPASLALVGIALLGAAASLRRARKA